MRRALLVVVLAACGQTGEKSDWEREHEAKLPAVDAVPSPPAYPRERDLIEFVVGPQSEFRFFVDPASLSVGNGGVVRYTLVARSPAGATNVSYEGLRCNSGEVRVYAIGRDGTWGGSATAWRPTQAQWHRALSREFFCPQREAIASREEGILALRRGGPSITRSLTEDTPRGGGAR